jgi:SOS-response transcriptional repressor LexA
VTKHDKFRAEHVLDVIVDFTETYGHPPSVRNIMARLELASTSAIHYHLSHLQRDGRIASCRCGCRRYWAVHDPQLIQEGSPAWVGPWPYNR